MSLYSPIAFSQSIIIEDITPAGLGGSLTLLGGMSIANTVQAVNLSSGAAIIAGGLAVQGNIHGSFANISIISSTIGTVLNLTSTNLISTNATLGNLALTNLSLQGLTVSNANITNQTATRGVFNTVSIGTLKLTTDRLALGASAGNTNQNMNCVAIGSQAAQYFQGPNATSIGYAAGQTSQGSNAIAIGLYTANENQGQHAVAIGSLAGQNTQGANAVAVGGYSGQTYQGLNAVAIGSNAGCDRQASKAIAIGNLAGYVSQGSNAVAIGYLAGQTSQHTNSIILNASGSALNSGTAGAFYVAPLRNITRSNFLGYDTTTKEITYFSPSDITFSNLVVSNISAATLNLSTGLTTSTILATNISTSTLNSNFISSATLDLSTGLTTSTIVATSYISTGTLYTNSISSANAYISNDLMVGGTLTTVNITTTNRMDTNMSAGIVLVYTYFAATGSSTIGNIFTTGGNVGIGTTSPNYNLDVAGSLNSNTLTVNSVNVTPSIGDISTEYWSYMRNNTNGNITGFTFNNNIVRSFFGLVHTEIRRSTGNTLFAKHELKGLQLASNWTLNQTYIGDNTGIIFGINPTGQVCYTSSNIANYSQSIIHYRASVTSTTSGIFLN